MILEKLYKNRMRNKVTNPFLVNDLVTLAENNLRETLKTQDHYMMILVAKELSEETSFIVEALVAYLLIPHIFLQSLLPKICLRLGLSLFRNASV